MAAAQFNTIITSGAYVGEEMQAEFGRIPPAFLPIGGSYLLQHQLREMKNREHIWLSLPEDFRLSESQEEILRDSDLSVIRVDASKSLGESIFQVILEVGPDLPLEVIHGDTLITDLSAFEPNIVSVNEAAAHYAWGAVRCDGDKLLEVRSVDQSEVISAEQMILSGYFSFAEPWRFVKCLVAQRFSFTGALNKYSCEVKVEAFSQFEALDCGHVKTFYSSRQRLAASRHFNSLAMEGGIVRKTSTDTCKIDAEANWLRSLPSDLQPFTIRLIEGCGAPKAGEYSTLYSNFPTVSELYLARTPRLVWTRIIDSCLEYLNSASKHIAPEVASPFRWLVIGKLRERLLEYPDHLPSDDRLLVINNQEVGTLADIVGYLTEIIDVDDSRPACIMHGDFCFSNMLFDLRSDRIQLIDPRGMIQGRATLYGDIRYDIAKFGHSIVGRYDQILGEKIRSNVSGSSFHFTIPADEERDWLTDRFFESSVGTERFDSPAVKAAMVSLFLSMIPLHSEDPERQHALFSNGLRLFAKFFAPTF